MGTLDRGGGPASDVRARLAARGWAGTQLGLSRVLEALARLGAPDRAMRVVHVAGTNGKGSVSAMVDAMVRAAGHSAGLYTSPHLEFLAERVKIGGVPIADAELDLALDEVLRIGPPDLTFFETITVAALVAMRNARVDVAVLEVGLGGRLDATNAVAAPAVSAITTIGMDHTAELGATLPAIARQKAGILRGGTPWVLGAVVPGAREAILGVAEAVGAPPPWHLQPWDAPAAERAIRYRAIPDGVEPAGAGWTLRAPLGLAGAHQAANAAVAAAVAKLGLGLNLDAVAAGLAGVRWPGRLERFIVSAGDRVVTVLLDCAHNVEGASALAAYLGAMPRPPAALVFGALADKDHRPMLAALTPHVRRVILTEGPSGRSPATPLEALAPLCPEAQLVREPERAYEAALQQAADGDSVVIAGSIYLVGALRGLVARAGRGLAR